MEGFRGSAARRALPFPDPFSTKNKLSPKHVPPGQGHCSAHGPSPPSCWFPSFPASVSVLLPATACCRPPGLPHPTTLPASPSPFSLPLVGSVCIVTSNSSLVWPCFCVYLVLSTMPPLMLWACLLCHSLCSGIFSLYPIYGLSLSNSVILSLPSSMHFSCAFSHILNTAAYTWPIFIDLSL